MTPRPGPRPASCPHSQPTQSKPAGVGSNASTSFQVVISDYEVGKLRISAEVALRLAAALEVPIRELLKTDSPPRVVSSASPAARCSAPGTDREPAPPQAGRHPHNPRSLPQERHRLAARSDLEPITNKAGQRPAFVRSAFDLRAAVGPAKPSGLGMVSGSQHAAGAPHKPACAPALRASLWEQVWPGRAADGPADAAGPHRAADGREPWPWSCGT